MIFVGTAEPGKPLLDPQILLDGFVVALRALSRGQQPGVTIDPTPGQLAKGLQENDHMPVRYLGGVEATAYGAVCFEADRLMKSLSFGKDNVTKAPFACDMVFLRRDADFCAGKFVRRDMARGAESRKSSLLGNAYACDEIIRARRLGLLFPYVFAGERSHVTGKGLVSCPRGALDSRRDVPGSPGPARAGFSLYRDRHRLVGPF